MEFNEKVFVRLYSILNDFLYHFYTYVELHKNFDKLKGYREFWVFTSDAHFKMIVLSWCMIFGSYSNKTHWKELKLNRDEFLQRLLGDLHITRKEWDEYNKKMLLFRNEFVAHRTIESIPTSPYFDLALKSVICLENWVREQMATSTFVDNGVTVCYINDKKPLSAVISRYKKGIKYTIQPLLKK